MQIDEIVNLEEEGQGGLEVARERPRDVPEEERKKEEKKKEKGETRKEKGEGSKDAGKERKKKVPREKEREEGEKERKRRKSSEGKKEAKESRRRREEAPSRLYPSVLLDRLELGVVTFGSPPLPGSQPPLQETPSSPSQRPQGLSPGPPRPTKSGPLERGRLPAVPRAKARPPRSPARLCPQDAQMR